MFQAAAAGGREALLDISEALLGLHGGTSVADEAPLELEGLTELISGASLPKPRGDWL